MWQGASGYSHYDGILSPAYTVLIPKTGIDSKFFAYVFKRTSTIRTFQTRSQGLTSDTWNLKYPELSNIEVMVPRLSEQQHISVFFETLDSSITLHQRAPNDAQSRLPIQTGGAIFTKQGYCLLSSGFSSFRISSRKSFLICERYLRLLRLPPLAL